MENEHFEKRVNCPVCGELGTDPFYSTSMTEGAVRSFISTHYEEQGVVDWSLLEGQKFELAHCGNCDLIYHVNLPKDHTLKHVYTEAIASDFLRERERRNFTTAEFFRTAGELAVLFRATGKAPLDVTFLDYGFGWGRWGRVARAMGATVYATEIGDDKKDLARSLGVTVIDDAEIDGRKFDIVHTEQVLEHLANPGRDFARLAAATGSVLKVAVPVRGRIKELLQSGGMPSVSPFYQADKGHAVPRSGGAYISVQPLEHLNAFSSSTMTWLADANQMKIVSHVRRRVPVADFTSARLLMNSLVDMARLAGKMIVKPDGGYYLFSPLGRR